MTITLLTVEDMRTLWANIPRYIVVMLFMETLCPFQQEKKCNKGIEPIILIKGLAEYIVLQSSKVDAHVLCKHISCRQLDQTNRISSVSTRTILN